MLEFNLSITSHRSLPCELVLHAPQIWFLLFQSPAKMFFPGCVNKNSISSVKSVDGLINGGTYTLNRLCLVLLIFNCIPMYSMFFSLVLGSILKLYLLCMIIATPPCFLFLSLLIVHVTMSSPSSLLVLVFSCVCFVAGLGICALTGLGVGAALELVEATWLYVVLVVVFVEATWLYEGLGSVGDGSVGNDCPVGLLISIVFTCCELLRFNIVCLAAMKAGQPL